MGYKTGTVLKTAFDTYKIQGERGAGASGTVFEARDSMGVLRAVKILELPKTASAGLKASRNEFNFCFRSSHKNIAQVLDCGLYGSKAVFYVMPLYTQSLRDLIAMGIPGDDVLRIFGEILDGVEAAHLHKIWHRILKPENILIDERGKEIVISDFGIARFEEEAVLASAGASDGSSSFPYAAPEQKIRGFVADGMADVYALGIILQEMFTANAASDHPSIAEVASNYAYLDWTVKRMTNPEPGLRPSIADVKRELIARGNEFLRLQRLNALKTEIILETEVDDPIIRQPITIQSVDFKDETLYLTLSTVPPTDWVKAFRESSSRSQDNPHGPERFIFLGKLVHLRLARGYDPEQLLELAKLYVHSANRFYVEAVRADRRQSLERERQLRRAQIAAEERRQQVLARLRL